MLRVVDAEAVIVPLAVAVIAGAVGFLGGDGWNRVRITGRLRANIAAESVLLKDLPADVRPLMERHLEHQTRLLLAEQEWFTWAERSKRAWGALHIAFAPLIFLLLSGLAEQGVLRRDWFTLVGLLLVVGVFTYGTHLRTTAIRSRNTRRAARRLEVDEWRERIGALPPAASKDDTSPTGPES